MGASPDFVAALGLIANCTGISTTLSPVPTFIRIVKNRSTEKFSCFPYIATLLSSLVWLIYGLITPGSLAVVTINIFSCAVQGSYCAIFLWFASSAESLRVMSKDSASPNPPKTLLDTLSQAATRRQLALAALAAAAAAVLAFGVLPSDRRSEVVGSFGDLLSIVSVAAPLSVLGLVVRTKSVEYLPLPLCVNNLLNSCAWGTFAVFKKDVYVGAPNIPGVILGLIQVGLHLVYGSPFFRPKPEYPVPRQNSISSRAALKSEKASLLRPDPEDPALPVSPKMHSPLLGGLERVNSEPGDFERPGIDLSVVTEASVLDDYSNGKRVSYISPADGQYPLLEANGEAPRGHEGGHRRGSVTQQYPVMERAQLLLEAGGKVPTQGQPNHRRASISMQYPVVESAQQMAGGSVSRRQSKRLHDEVPTAMLLGRMDGEEAFVAQPIRPQTPVTNGGVDLTSWEGLLQGQVLINGDCSAEPKRNA